MSVQLVIMAAIKCVLTPLDPTSVPVLTVHINFQVMEKRAMVCLKSMSFPWLWIIFSIDVDECSKGSHNCDQICTNTDGSFTCSCEPGFKLSTDRKSCIGMYYIYYTLVYIIHNSIVLIFMQTLMNATRTMVAVSRNVLILLPHLCVPVEVVMYLPVMESIAMVSSTTMVN